MYLPIGRVTDVTAWHGSYLIWLGSTELRNLQRGELNEMEEKEVCEERGNVTHEVRAGYGGPRLQLPEDGRRAAVSGVLACEIARFRLCSRVSC